MLEGYDWSETRIETRQGALERRAVRFYAPLVPVARSPAWPCPPSAGSAPASQRTQAT